MLGVELPIVDVPALSGRPARGVRTMKKPDRKNLAFWNAYDTLSRDGLCDSPGGDEYRRVLADWIENGRPEPIADFIRKKANAGWVVLH